MLALVLCSLHLPCPHYIALRLQVNMLGAHVVIDLSSHLSPIIQSVLLHRPSIVQVRVFSERMRVASPSTLQIYRCRRVTSGQPLGLAGSHRRSLDRLLPVRRSVHVRSALQQCLLPRFALPLMTRAGLLISAFARTQVSALAPTHPISRVLVCFLQLTSAGTEGMAYIAGSYQVNSNMLHHPAIPHIDRQQVRPRSQRCAIS